MEKPNGTAGATECNLTKAGSDEATTSQRESSHSIGADEWRAVRKSSLGRRRKLSADREIAPGRSSLRQSLVPPTTDEWEIVKNQFNTSRNSISSQNSEITGSSMATMKIVALMVHNLFIERVLRRKILGHTLKSAEWFEHFGSGSILHTLRLYKRVIAVRVVHILLTLVVWQHFFYVRYEQQIQAYESKSTSNYNWKVLATPIVYGLKHAILFQFVLLPLTVSRSILTWLGSVSSVLPFEHMITFHIHIGYTFCILTAGAGLLLFVYFGKLCQDYKDGMEDDNVCAKFEAEIMYTGYTILVVTLLIFLSGYFRGRVSFEHFHSVHVFSAGFLVAGSLIHTLDAEFRRESKVGQARSQSYPWIIGSLAVYLVDVIWQYVTQETRLLIIYYHVYADGGAVTLDIAKPWWFVFTAGHYVHLQIPAIDTTWHPFSIGSSSHELIITLIIEVKGKGQWTQRLAELLSTNKLLSVNLRGPFGYSVGPPLHSKAAANIVAIGTGTGIVPMLSLLKSRVLMLAQLSGDGLSRAEDALHHKQNNASMMHCFINNVSPRVNEAIRNCQLRYRLKQLIKYEQGDAPEPKILREALKKEHHYYVTGQSMLALCWVCIEIATSALVLSWSNLEPPASASVGMTQTMKVLVSCLILPYAIVVFLWGKNSSQMERTPILPLLVLSMVAMVGTVTMLIVYGKFEQGLSPVEQVALIAWSGWRLGAIWMYHNSKLRGHDVCMAIDPIESFKLLWTTRSAELAMGVLDDLDATVRELEHSIHGRESKIVGTPAFRHLEIQVWCTDRRPDRVSALKSFIKGTRFENSVTFGRPKYDLELASIMRSHIISPSFMKMPVGEKKICSVTFSGSQVVSSVIYRAVKHCGELAVAAGATNFHLTYRSESYSNMPPRRSRQSLFSQLSKSTREEIKDNKGKRRLSRLKSLSQFQKSVSPQELAIPELLD